MALWRSKTEVEGCGKKYLKAVQVGKDYITQCGTVQREVEECVASEPGRALNSTTKWMADRREECAL